MATLSGPARSHVEQYGGALVRVTWLTIICAGQMVALILAGSTIVVLARRPTQPPPIVLRDAAGRASVADVEALQYHPTDADLRGAIARFFELRFTRIRRTLDRDYPSRLYFLGQPLRDQERSDSAGTEAIRTFITDQSQDEVEVIVSTVSLDDAVPGHERGALVDYDLIYVSSADQREQKRERFTARVQFHQTTDLDPTMQKVNLPGVQITRYTPVKAFAN